MNAKLPPQGLRPWASTCVRGNPDNQCHLSPRPALSKARGFCNFFCLRFLAIWLFEICASPRRRSGFSINRVHANSMIRKYLSREFIKFRNIAKESGVADTAQQDIYSIGSHAAPSSGFAVFRTLVGLRISRCHQHMPIAACSKRFVNYGRCVRRPVWRRRGWEAGSDATKAVGGGTLYTVPDRFL